MCWGENAKGGNGGGGGGKGNAGGIADLCKATAKLSMATARQVAALEACFNDHVAVSEAEGQLGEDLVKGRVGVRRREQGDEDLAEQGRAGGLQGKGQSSHSALL